MILAAMDIAGDSNKEFHVVDSLKKEELEGEKYMKINPTGRIPTLIEGSFHLLGSGDLGILFYLCATH